MARGRISKSQRKTRSERRYWHRKKREERRNRVRLHFANEASHASDVQSRRGHERGRYRHDRSSPSLSPTQIPANISDEYVPDSDLESDVDHRVLSAGEKRSHAATGLDEDGPDVDPSKFLVFLYIACACII